MHISHDPLYFCLYSLVLKTISEKVFGQKLMDELKDQVHWTGMSYNRFQTSFKKLQKKWWSETAWKQGIGTAVYLRPPSVAFCVRG